MPEVLGAIGRVQLKKLPESIRRRRSIASRYSQVFSKLDGVSIPYVRRPEDHNFQLYTVRVDPAAHAIDRDGWISELASRQVSSRLYFPTLHQQGVFSRFPKAEESLLENSLAYAKTAFSLPIFATLSDSNQDAVIEAVADVHQKFKR